jgi:hypothetical protein
VRTVVVHDLGAHPMSSSSVTRCSKRSSTDAPPNAALVDAAEARSQLRGGVV